MNEFCCAVVMGKGVATAARLKSTEAPSPIMASLTPAPIIESLVEMTPAFAEAASHAAARKLRSEGILGYR